MKAFREKTEAFQEVINTQIDSLAHRMDGNQEKMEATKSTDDSRNESPSREDSGEAGGQSGS
jgi:hypothetical protein